MNVLRVELSMLEEAEACRVGSGRRSLGRRHTAGEQSPKSAKKEFRWHWGNDIEAAGAELAVAKVTGLYWHALAMDHRTLPADCGGDVQVKYSPAMNMIVNADNDPSHRYVLVQGRMPAYGVLGWLHGCDAQQKQFLGPGDGPDREAYFVPPQSLNPIIDIANLAAWPVAIEGEYACPITQVSLSEWIKERDRRIPEPAERKLKALVKRFMARQHDRFAGGDVARRLRDAMAE